MEAERWCSVGIRVCLGSEAWAAWVQAIGSILALAVAIAIAWWQTSRQRRDAKREREERTQSARSLAILWADQLHDCAARLEKAASPESISATYEAEAAFDDILEWGKRLPFEMLPRKVADSVVEMRARALSDYERVSGRMSQGRTPSWDWRQATWKSFRIFVDGHHKVITDTTGAVAPPRSIVPDADGNNMLREKDREA